ncbi:MAG TPA: bifunctional alpha/beta hydrolase/OsmC family protein [Syntrophobacteraceae bacterium]|nr:bifunctional alpha/beta hydrolase/OsmC family protein [Syntrophobacteraceae bacterium]
MQFQKVAFKNAEGRMLSGRLDLPVDEMPDAYAIFAHCFTCTKNLNAVVNINRALAREGFGVLRFDFTGLGESEGEFAETGFSNNVEDLVAAARFLASDFQAPQLLIGHSLGGAAVLQAASRIPSVKAVATIGAPFDLTDLSGHLGTAEETIRERGEAEVHLGGRSFTIKQHFFDDLRRAKIPQVLENLERPLLVLHSEADNIVGIDHAVRLFQTARFPKSFVSLDRADHLLSQKADSLYVGSVLASWARRYMDPPRKESRSRDLKDNRIVARIGRRGYQTEILANGHSLVADEPIAVGGADTGPSPYDFLVAALGACTAMTLRMYADRKDWPLGSAVVRLKHRKIHAKDCKECESKDGMMDQIEREIELEGPLDENQRSRLLEIADRCPVHRTLHSPIAVKTRLKD